MMNTKLPVSVALISYNEEDNIGRTLESIAGIAGEIIVVDSGSADRTTEIAEGYGAKVFREEWKGHTEQKNSALKKCSLEWMLFLDCDEVPTNELKLAISQAVNNSQGKAFSINRKTFYLGKLMEHSWQPDLKVRLVHKSAGAYWTGLNPHDGLEVNCDAIKLEGWLVHYSYKDIMHHFRKTLDYSKISAQSYLNEGRRFTFGKLLFDPFLNWFKIYVLNRAFLDGVRGMIAGISAYLSTFLKYAFLWELEKNADNKEKHAR
jgi:glycosyltransferase involved in cell wall biosynthesis